MSIKNIAIGITSLSLIVGLGFWIAKGTQKPSQNTNASVLGAQETKVAQSSTSVDPSTEKPDLYVPELEILTDGVSTTQTNINTSVNSFDATSASALTYNSDNSIQRTTAQNTNTSTTKLASSNTDDHDTIDKEKVSIIHTPTAITSAPLLAITSQPSIPLGIVNKQISSNIDNKLGNVPLNQVLQITFEQPITEEFVSFLKFSPPLEFNRIIKGNQLTIAPLKSFKQSTTYTFGVNSGGVCTFGNSGNNCQQNDLNSFKISFTTDFKESFSFGKSVEGRDLVAYKFGQCTDSACRKVMLTGGLHGSEWRAGDLTSLKDWLNNNPQEIVGKNKEFLIIPFTNPDGTAKNQRFNAHGVNLNRNFPSSWVACDTCGLSPASEPETKALVDITNAFKPNFLISYHAQWPPEGIIFRGDDKNPATQSFAQWVSDRTGYSVGIFPDFTGSVPGDQVVWGETIGARGLVIEASNIDSTDWNKNVNMYLSLLRENY